MFKSMVVKCDFLELQRRVALATVTLWVKDVRIVWHRVGAGFYCFFRIISVYIVVVCTNRSALELLSCCQ